MVYVFSCWIGPTRIVTSSMGILLVEDGLVLFKALSWCSQCPGQKKREQRKKKKHWQQTFHVEDGSMV